MYEKLFLEYNPKSYSSHPILLLYVESLNEDDTLVLIDELFELKIWNLPSEIYKKKYNDRVYDKILHLFQKQFSQWIQERTDYSHQAINKVSKNQFSLYN